MTEDRRSHGNRMRLAQRLADLHPSGMIHGALVMGATLALLSHKTAAEVSLLGAGGVLTIYWLSHAYTHALGRGMDGDPDHLALRLVRSTRHEAPVFWGGLPPLVVCAVVLALGGEVATAMLAGLWVTVVLMAGYGYLAAHQAGVSGWRAGAETAFAALLGLFMVALNTLLH
ncbi:MULTISPECIES: hypothetical protein [Aeromicrobium]|uniref:hypothetical protein n=1 Tax=Aeromicrobium TaxID=2040 RepID=UPI00257EB150|nr:MULTISPECIES: hypothetical protein [Aeromicrobium]